MNTKVKLLSALMWFLAAWEFVNALGTTFFLETGASAYGWSNYLENSLTRNAFHQYGMLLYVLAVAYAIIATDVVKYEQLLWIVVVEQIAGEVLSFYEFQAAPQIISYGNFILAHVFQVVVVAALWFLRPSKALVASVAD
jgi:hypothetical protein